MSDLTNIRGALQLHASIMTADLHNYESILGTDERAQEALDALEEFDDLCARAAAADILAANHRYPLFSWQAGLAFCAFGMVGFIAGFIFASAVVWAS